jgi:hypothetical protein
LRKPDTKEFLGKTFWFEKGKNRLKLNWSGFLKSKRSNC